MSVYKDKRTGNYCYKFMYKGVLYHRCFKGAKRDEVASYEFVARSELIKSGYDIAAEKRYTLEDILEDYKQYAYNKYSRPEEAIKIVERFWHLVGNKMAKEVTPSDIEHYRTIRRGVVTNNSINREVDNIRKMFSLAKSNRKININPCDDIEDLRIINRTKRYLSKEEEVKLLEVASPLLKVVIILAIQTGMRLSEITNLKWEDVYIDQMYIRVLNPKNNKPREVIITPDIYTGLKTLPVLSEYVFTNPKTGTKYRDFKKAFKTAVKRAGIPYITFHELRHTTGSRMNEKGVDLETIKEYLGHADARTTQGYIHKPKESILDAARKLSEY